MPGCGTAHGCERRHRRLTGDAALDAGTARLRRTARICPYPAAAGVPALWAVVTLG